MVDYWTAKVVTDALLYFLSGEQASRFNDGPFAMHPMRGSIRLSQGLLVGNQHGMMRTPGGRRARLSARSDCAAGANGAPPYSHTLMLLLHRFYQIQEVL